MPGEIQDFPPAPSEPRLPDAWGECSGLPSGWGEPAAHLPPAWGAPGQVVLPCAEAQFDFAGTALEPPPPPPLPPPAGTLDNPLPAPLPRSLDGLPREVPEQLAFEFGADVQLTLADWQERTARCLDALGAPSRAQRFRGCGSRVVVRRCASCAIIDWKSERRSADCESRVCPRCARETAQQHRARLRAALQALPGGRRGRAWWLHTLTVPRPRGTSVERLRRDETTAWNAWRACWEFLKGLKATHAWAHLEVSPSGLVHVHVAVRSRWLRSHELAELRATAVRFGAGKQYNVRRLRKNGTAEVAKYLCKGVARSDAGARQTHPLLAAMVDTALYGRRTVRQYGTEWPNQNETAEDTWRCSSCGCALAHQVYLTDAQADALRAADQARAA